MVETDGTILQALAHYAAQLPGRTALVYGDTRYTWRELDEITDRAAAELYRRGVRQGDCVGMQIISGMGIVAIFSILKTGAAYLPLNPAFPEERLSYMRNNGRVKMTLFEKDMESLIGSEKGKLPQDITGLDRLAVMHTSGSTGLPKPVHLFHRDMLPYTRYYIKLAGITEDTRMVMYVGFSFVVHLMSLYVWAFSGAMLHILPAEIRLDIRQIADYFNEHAITDVVFPTGLGQKFVANTVTPALQTVVLGGEKPTPFTFANKQVRVFNAYGCTETVSAVMLGEVFSGDTELHNGKGVDGIGLTIVDEEGNPVPDGTKGELWVTLFDRLHKTGDLVKRNKDGNIVVVGRKDFQINVRGYRVEPSEIELCMLRVPGIAEAVAVSHSERIVAYYASDEEVLPKALKAYLSQHLPPYMIPSMFVHLNKLPRNVNGKIDRAALPEPVHQKTNGEAPQTGAEEKLAAVWSTVLGVEQESIMRYDSFHELGGDSLGLIMLAVEIEEKLHISVTPAKLWEAGTLAKQAELISSAKDFSPIFTFRAEGNRTPLFFLHSANTGPEVYGKLAALLPEDLPFYAFEHRNLASADNLGIRELARIYVDEMLELVPWPAYTLAGWSMGGHIAFEMALIMERKGVPLQHLYLIDPEIFGDEERDIYAKLDSSPYYQEYLKNEPLFTRYRDAGRLERLISNNAFLIKEVSKYRPEGTLGCPVTLFRMTLPDSAEHATEGEQALLSRLWDLRKPDGGFGPFTKNLTVIDINGTHDRWLTDTSNMTAIVKEIVHERQEESNE